VQAVPIRYAFLGLWRLVQSAAAQTGPLAITHVTVTEVSAIGRMAGSN
jgi:hypothetical protein